MVGDPTPPWISPSGVALSFAISSLVCLAVCALASWIGGGVVFVLALSSSWLVGLLEGIITAGERIGDILNIGIGALAFSSALSRCGWARCDVVWPFVLWLGYSQCG